MSRSMSKRSLVLGLVLLTSLLALLLLLPSVRNVGDLLWTRLQARSRKRSVRDVLRVYGPAAQRRLRPFFVRAGVPFPPRRVVFLGLKKEKKLELWARGKRQRRLRYIRTWPVLAASGHRGPKLREGDSQVPEGFYRLTWLHPNSWFHLSVKLNYPNRFDRKHARREKRRRPGSNIFIHGKQVSDGCLALGDKAIEEVFVMLARTGLRRSRIVIAPHDPRVSALRPRRVDPQWLRGLYRSITREFRKYPLSRRTRRP